MQGASCCVLDASRSFRCTVKLDPLHLHRDLRSSQQSREVLSLAHCPFVLNPKSAVLVFHGPNSVAGHILCLLSPRQSPGNIGKLSINFLLSWSMWLVLVIGPQMREWEQAVCQIKGGAVSSLCPFFLPIGWWMNDPCSRAQRDEHGPHS